MNTETGVQSQITGSGADDVEYTPWLDTSTNNVMSGPGFNGDYSKLDVGSGGVGQSGGRINAAIGDLTAGGTIKVYNGTYAEDVVIGEALTLEAASGQTNVVVQGDSSAAAMAVNAAGVTVEGQTIEGGSGQWSLTIEAAATAHVKDNVFGGTGLGNVETADALNVISGNTFTAPPVSNETGFEQYNDTESGDDTAEISGLLSGNTFNRGVYVYDTVGSGDLRTIWADIQPAINAAVAGRHRHGPGRHV